VPESYQGYLLMDFKGWIDETAQDPFLKEATRRALTYVTNQWVALNRYLEDGLLPGCSTASWTAAGNGGGGNRPPQDFGMAGTEPTEIPPSTSRVWPLT